MSKSSSTREGPNGTTTWYRQLDGGKLLQTLRRMREEITEIFPESGLSGVTRELEELCRLSRERIQWIARPIWWLRIPRYLIALGLGLLGIYSVFHLFELFTSKLPVEEIVQTSEAEVGLLVYGGAVALFVWGLERRIKRGRALAAIHELRSIIHVIDMHQISKDPDWTTDDAQTLGGGSAQTLPELLRYLDYCSDLLGLSGKVAALYLREMDDPAVVGAVQEVEELGTGLARKIWQKITLLMRLHDGETR